MNAVSARNPFSWIVFRLLGRKLSDQSPHEYRFEQGEAWFRTPPSEEWRPLDSVPDPAALITELTPGPIVIEAERSGYTGEQMWHVVEVTEVGCDYDDPDLWAEWAEANPHK